MPPFLGQILTSCHQRLPLCIRPGCGYGRSDAQHPAGVREGGGESSAATPPAESRRTRTLQMTQGG